MIYSEFDASALPPSLFNLTGEQTLDMLRRLAAGKGAVAEAIQAEAKRVLATVDIEETAISLSWPAMSR